MTKKLTKKTLYEEGTTRCDECTLLERQFCPSYHPQDYGHIQQYRLMFVGQAPGETEAITKQPFTGGAGKVHYSVCRQAGINKMMICHANTVSCWPPRDPKGNDRKPTIREKNCCFEYLKKTIHKAKPKLIVALGEDAMWSLTRKTGISSQRGHTHPLITEFEYSCLVYCCYHPSYVMRQRQWIPLQVENYKEAIKVLQHGVPKEQKMEFLLDPTAEELSDYLNDKEIVYGVDTETTGLNVRRDKIIGHSFARTGGSACAIAYTGPGDERRRVVESFLSDDTRKKCWQNGSFDTSILLGAWGINDNGFAYDTRLGQQLLSSDLPSDLDFLRGQYTTIKPYKPPKKEMKNIASWGKEKMLTYAAWDAVTTFQVMEAQKEKLSDAQIELMQTLLIPLVKAINKMEIRGVLVDQNAIAGIYSQLQPMEEERAKPFLELGINPKSPPQLIKYFGVKSTSEDMLLEYMRKKHKHSELMQQLIDYREVQTTISKYVKGIYKRLENGRIHTHYQIDGTGTGRLSSKDPNLQNVPEYLRVIYVPDVGCYFISADYSQIELWVGAIISDEQQMLKDLQDGVDIHYESAKLCFPDNPLKYGNRKEDFNHDEQLRAKAVVFGSFYGRSSWSIAREFQVKVKTADEWKYALIRRYPGVSRYHEQCRRAVERQGYVETPFGRKRYVEKVTEGYNTPIQSTASDILLGAIVEADRLGLTPVLTVHDDVTFQVPINEFDDHLRKIKMAFERPIKQLNGTRFKASYKKGENWYEMERIDAK